MKQEKVNELFDLIVDFAIKNDYSASEVLAILSMTFVETMHRTGYSQDFMNKTCDHLKDIFKIKRDRTNYDD